MQSLITYNLQAVITLFPSEKGGRKNPVYSGYRPSFTFNTPLYYCGEIHLLEKQKLIPGETSRANIKMLPASTIGKNLKPLNSFIITEGNRPVGKGIIAEVVMK